MIYFCGLDLRAEKHARQTEAAREVLLAALRLEYGLQSLPEIAEDAFGKPYFPEHPDICFNYSHCRAGILAGLGREKIGVDAETVRSFKDSLAARICHPREAAAVGGQPDRDLALTKLWTAKEAYLKYTGEGIRRDLRELDMSGILADGWVSADAALRLWVLGDVCLCACVCPAERGRLELRHIIAPGREIGGRQHPFEAS